MPRTYDNEHRQKQAQATRDRILAVMAESLAQGESELPLREIAERAGVSLRTLHNHFPDQEARLSALSEYIDTRAMKNDPGPKTAAEIGNYGARAMLHFFENEELLRAQLTAGFAEEVRARRKKKRNKNLSDAVAQVAPEAESSKLVAAVLLSLVRGETAVFLKDKMGLSPTEIARAIRYASEAIVDRVATGENVPEDVLGDD